MSLWLRKQRQVAWCSVTMDVYTNKSWNDDQGNTWSCFRIDLGLNTKVRNDDQGKYYAITEQGSLRHLNIAVGTMIKRVQLTEACKSPAKLRSMLYTAGAERIQTRSSLSVFRSSFFQYNHWHLLIRLPNWLFLYRKDAFTYDDGDKD